MGIWDTISGGASAMGGGMLGMAGGAYGAAKGIGKSVFGSPDHTGGTQSYDWTEVEKQRANEAATRAAQEDFGQQLQARAAGEGPSVAEELLKAQQAKQISAASSLAASSRGGMMNANLAQLQAGNMQQATMADTAAQAALLRAQEQAAAEQAYAQFLAHQRAQDAGMFGAELGPQMGIGGNQLAWQQGMLQADQQDAASRRQLYGSILNSIGGAAGGGAK